VFSTGKDYIKQVKIETVYNYDFIILFLIFVLLVQEKHRYSPWWVPGRGHNDIIADNEEVYLNQINSFLQFVNKQ
jgi:hypothetical protein